MNKPTEPQDHIHHPIYYVCDFVSTTLKSYFRRVSAARGFGVRMVIGLDWVEFGLDGFLCIFLWGWMIYVWVMHIGGWFDYEWFLMLLVVVLTILYARSGGSSRLLNMLYNFWKLMLFPLSVRWRICICVSAFTIDPSMRVISKFWWELLL